MLGIKWHQFIRSGKMTTITKEPSATAVIESRRLSIFGHTVQRDLRAYNLTLNEAVNLAQNRPLCRMISTYGATHS